MAALVRAGYARPGQSSDALLDSFSLDMLLDVAYGQIIEGLSPEQRAGVDKQLAEPAEATVHDIADAAQAKRERIARNRAVLAGLRKK